MNKEITLDDLQEWKASQEYDYAHYLGEDDSKRISVDLNGTYRVYHNDIQVHIGMQPFRSVEVYNGIII